MNVDILSKSDLKIRNDDQFDLLLATTEIGLWELDVKTGVATRNLRHDQIFGFDTMLPHWSVDEFLTFLDENERERVATLIEASIAKSRGWDFEVAINLLDGSRRWIRARGLPKFTESGEMTKVVGHVIDITQTKESEERLRLLADELNHRVKNTLAIVQGIAKQTFGSENAKTRSFLDRLSALTRAHDVLLNTAWSNADLRITAERILKMGPARAITITRSSPKIRLAPTVAVAYAMALHELCTNAIKYGSLSVEGGTVEIDWRLSESAEDLVVVWKERGGPVPDANPEAGFGTVVVKSALEAETQGRVDMDFAQEGLTVTMRAPVKTVLADES